MVSSFFANLISQGGFITLRMRVPEPVSQHFPSFIHRNSIEGVLMKCTLQDMMNSYRPAFLLRLLADDTLGSSVQKDNFSSTDLVFLCFFLLILDHFLHNTDCILMNASLCLVMITFPLKISFDPYHPDALLSMFRSQATSLCST